ncbi:MULTISPECIES: polysaccharide deacetylase family protein [unclassified Clostridium]|jgi:peptidoglycan/xylan/chitin deacetylase (PgdA/CDA1 family)|uniref:polysaccharide deacetylase family protein n=1 Tax=Clostridia TaxID=186801 RepID=UPI0011058724|nr:MULTISPECIES: polysaccharide deacetylase family protein [unclassified Clostridium]
MNPYNQHYRTRKKRRVNKKRFLPFLIAVIILGGAATVSLAAAIRNISGAVTANGDAVQSAAAVLDQQPEETPMPPEAAPTPVATPTPAPTPAPTNLVDYTGPIEHVFVHPLVVYPELAFDGDAQSKGMDDYMTTVDEFRTMLEELYANDYVLMNVDKMYGEKTDENGNTTYGRLKFQLPEGKKPVIISTDDMNYYQYMRENGCNWKMVVGEDGHIAEMSVDPKTGQEVVTQGNEVFSIINQFLEEHPDFSFDGSKAIVGLTGYDGILGYRTNRESENRESEIEAVKPVIECLKNDGFQFASHSYAHAHMSKWDAAKVREDCQKWKDEVESLIGKTHIYLFPYGEYPKQGSDAYNVFLEFGFDYFSGVGLNTYQKVYEKGYTFDDRKNIDGMTMRSCLKEGPNGKKDNGQPTTRAQVWAMMDVNKVFNQSARGSEPGKGIGVK